MPKEISHIALAGQIAANLPETSLFHRPVKDFRHVFLYGSVAPDVPYFYLFGKKAGFIQALTHRFHTCNRKSLLPILNFLKQFPKNDPDALAFAAGVCCHILCDTHFHPMVYYFAGLDDVHNGATARHRFFETAMDIHFWYNMPDRQLRSLRYLFDHIETDRLRFQRFFHSLYSLTGTPESHSLNRAIQYHQIIQTLFFRPRLFKLFRFLNTHRIIKKKRFHALVYPFNPPVQLPFFNSPITFQDPNLGKKQTCAMETLAHRAAKGVITLLNLIEDALNSKNNLERIAGHPDLPRISPCPDSRKKKFKYWYQKEQIESQLYAQN